jgi:hypothetical protein
LENIEVVLPYFRLRESPTSIRWIAEACSAKDRRLSDWTDVMGHFREVGPTADPQLTRLDSIRRL